jgi:hypothetical protein
MQDLNNFWLHNPSILYKKYLEFFPSSKMSKNNKLNAITRFFIYFLIIAFIMEKSVQLQILICLAIILIVVYYYVDKQMMIKQTKQNQTLVGYYDPNGNLIMSGSENASELHEQIKSFQESEKERLTSCKAPTVDNPFMNKTIKEIQENAPDACNVDDDEIKEKITQKFNENLYRDVSDVFEVENSQRLFHTVKPIDTPDQPAFAKWLYNTNGNCKTDQSKCLKYEDLRFKR